MSIEASTQQDPGGDVVPLQAPQPSVLPASHYLMSGAPTTCAACSRPFASNVDHRECWHGRDGRYYCGPACEPAPRRSGHRSRGERKAA